MSELWKLSAVETAAKVRAREVSARDVTEAALARLSAVNPKLNAVVQEFPQEALDRADAVDRMLAEGKDPGPMAGVPITIKVNMDQIGHATTNGLRLNKDVIAKTNHPLVDNVLKAGAVVIGRTNTPAFSIRWFTDNDLHGRTYNPHDRDITPGGSSGGASSAVAAGIGAIAQGNDIAGSVRYPAYACGVHGLRPTLGRIPMFNASGAERGINAQLMAVQGPLARTIDDVRLSLAAMSAFDPRDPWWVPAPLEGPAYAKTVTLCLRPGGLDIVPEVESALREAAARLTDAGWSVTEIDDLPAFNELVDINTTLWHGTDGFAETLENFAREGNEAAMNTMKYVFSHLPKSISQVDFSKVITRRATLLREYLMMFQNTSALLIPNSGRLPLPQDHDGKSLETGRETFAAQSPQMAIPALGLPGLSVAMDKVGTIPNGVQLVASRYREDILLAAGDDIANRGAAIDPVDPNW